MLEEKILCVVDDDEIYQFIIKRIIEKKKLPCKILVFNDGRELYNYLVENKSSAEKLPGALLLDINMPEMDGWEFIEQYRKIEDSLSKRGHIYVVTSSVNSKDEEKARAYSEIKDFIEKPFDVDHLVRIVDEAP